MDNKPPETGFAAPAAGSRDQTAQPAGQGREPASTENDLWQALAATRILPDALGDQTPPAADVAEPASEVRRAVPGQRGDGQLGDFRLLKKLGEGAMGAVYKARQLSFNRDVALKLLFKHIAANPKLVERFYREARVAGRLDHPNIVRGYEVGEEAGWHYFAMEYVPGKSLQKLLTALRQFSVPDALYIVLRVARGLQYAHAEGLVHRDVKPENILVTRTGVVKLADLGMVKLQDEEMSLTQTGHAVGTPWYMPMEQVRNAKDADGRCDIYALGCTLYYLLTGQPPFSGKTLVEVIQAKEVGSFPPARQANRAVPERLDLLIAKMTAKHPKHRYQDCGELLRDLEGLGLAGPGLSFLASGGGALPAAGAEAVPEPTPEPQRAAAAAIDAWYVRYNTPAGRMVTRKLTAAQVLELVESEHFDPATRASRSPDEGFRAPATYREFEPVVLGRVTKSGADRKVARYRKLYKQIEDEGLERERAQEESAAAGRSWVGLGLGVGALAAAVYFLARWLAALAG